MCTPVDDDRELEAYGCAWWGHGLQGRERLMETLMTADLEPGKQGARVSKEIRLRALKSSVIQCYKVGLGKPTISGWSLDGETG